MIDKISSLIDNFTRQLQKEKRFIAKVNDFISRLELSDLSQKEKRDVINISSGKSQYTLPHIMARYNTKSELWKKIKTLGYDFNAVDQSGLTAFMISVKQSDEGYRVVLLELPDSIYNYKAVDKSGNHIFEHALMGGNLAVAKVLIEKSPDVKEYVKSKKIIYTKDKEKTATMNGLKAFKFVYNKAWESEENFYKSLLNILSQYGNLEDGVGYINSYNGVTDLKGNFNHVAFARFLPSFYTSHQYYNLDLLLEDLEDLMDNRRDIQERFHHPSTAEFLALLSHPGNIDQDHNILTSSFTSPYALIDLDINEISSYAVQTLKVVGILGLSFRQFKFDAIRKEIYHEELGIIKDNSLLEHYGFIAIDKSDFPSSFGAGFYLKTSGKEIAHDIEHYGKVHLSEGTVVAFMRGGFLVCNDEGSVFIRNSSLKFGRNLLQEPAYYLDTAYITEDMSHQQIVKLINRLTPEDIERKWTHILHTDLYLNNEDKINSAGELVKQLYLTIQDYAKWQCDMDYETAWLSDDDGNDFVVGAYKSPGFKFVVESLVDNFLTIENEKLLYGETDKLMPSFGFVPRGLIPFQSYVRLELGEMQISALKNLVANADDIEYDLIKESGVYDFFQQGFEYNSLLIIQDNLNSIED